MANYQRTRSQARRQSTFFFVHCILATLMSITMMKIPLVDAARFAVTGPVLTVTLKDPSAKSSSSNSIDDSASSSPPSWGLNLNELRPTLNWSIQSKSKPLPNWFPSLQSIRSTLGYHYDESHKYTPSYLENEVSLASSHFKGVRVKLQPSYEFRSKRGLLVLQASRGTSYALAQFTSTGKRWLTFLKGCYQVDLPYASVGAIRITPSYDLTQNEPSCTLEATTGSQRTKAVVNLEYQNPTLSVVHALDDRHIISPEISLYNARIIYQWKIALNSGSIHTKVDPTDAVYVTWTDQSMTGKWVTDVRFPLSGTVRSALAANVRVKRQFTF